MDPDLMSSTGMQLQPEQVYDLEPRYYGGVRTSLTPLRGNTHTLSVALAPGDRRVYAHRTGVQMAPYQRRVAPMDPARGDGGAEPSVRQIGLGNDHETRRVPVQPMDDSWSPLGPSGEGGTPSDQRVDEGVVPMARCRVNYQAGRLVDDGEVLVLENERQGDGGRLERSGWLVVRDLNRYDLTPDKEPGGASYFSVDSDPLVCNQTRGLGSRDRHLVGKKPIQALGFRTNNSESDFASRIWLGLGT